jgi:hypothetical protein
VGFVRHARTGATRVLLSPRSFGGTHFSNHGQRDLFISAKAAADNRPMTLRQDISSGDSLAHPLHDWPKDGAVIHDSRGTHLGLRVNTRIARPASTTLIENTYYG